MQLKTCLSSEVIQPALVLGKRREVSDVEIIVGLQKAGQEITSISLHHGIVDLGDSQFLVRKEGSPLLAPEALDFSSRRGIVFKFGEVRKQVSSEGSNVGLDYREHRHRITREFTTTKLCL